MTSRHQIDTTTSYRRALQAGLPARRQIERVDGDDVPAAAPEMQELSAEPYIADDSLIEAVDLAIALGRPLLLQGDPGCGKTRLAYAVAYALGLPLEVSHVTSTSRARDLLYTYDAVNRLYDAQLGADTERDGQEQAMPRSRFIRNYIHFGPLGRAIVRAKHGRRSVMLIDEIDKADIDFPNDLLWELDRLEFQVVEDHRLRYSAGDDPALRPIIIVTHNEEKSLPPAFLRRCIFHYVHFPEQAEQLEHILKTHALAPSALTERAIEVLLSIRAIDISKKPGLSELLDWVGYLDAVQTPLEDLFKLPYLGVLLKQESDQRRARWALLASSEDTEEE